MRTRPSVLGVIMTRDEWPLLAASVTHALENVADVVWVVDHASEDRTLDGLSRLQAKWGERLKVFSLGSVPFLQEAVNTVMLEFARRETFDWIYFFDADEFALSASPTSLHDALAEVPEDVGVVRYNLVNWISPRDTNGHHLPDLLRVRYRSSPNVFVHLAGVLLVDQIAHGNATFFDIPFESKILVRRGFSAWLAGGSHGLGDPTTPTETRLDPRVFHVAHVALFGYDRLGLRVRHGQSLLEAGFPIEHGWQSHVIGQMASEGRLEEYWRAHSVDESDPASGPRYQRDDSLALALRPTIDALDALEVDGERVGSATPRQIDAPTILRALRLLQTWRESWRQDHDDMVDAYQRSRASAERLEAQLAEVTRQRDELERGLDEIRASRTWRYGQRLRAAVRFGRPS